MGLRGHRALIRKTANDDLQNDIWRHMDKIVPSIVFNLEVPNEYHQTSVDRSATTTTMGNASSHEQTSPTSSTSPEQIELIERETTVINDNPPALAHIVLKDLFCRAHLNNIIVCVQPILTHLDNHSKWIPVDFPKFLFAEIMSSIKHHNSYLIIELLLGHLEKHFDQRNSAHIKTSIMNIIQDCMVFAAANTGAGSTMFASISRLLKFLKKSFQIFDSRRPTSTIDEHERNFQTAVINGIVNFAEKLPDFQMMEIMQFIITSLASLSQEYDENNSNSSSREANLRLQLLLLTTVKKVTSIFCSFFSFCFSNFNF